ncbi:MAG: AsmA family protein [gamma proteobacterium symbiont of Taylorina sp.]|nr:AsmA family protein [gamma proteobacterium symbiont of Taylorina sp.]
MAKLIKILLWITLILVIIIALAAILIPILVDPNDYKEEISQQVYQQTGRTLSIEGDIDIAVSLPLSVSLELGKMTLSNAKGFSDKPFAQMQGASIYVAILPLINENRMDIGEIKLSHLKLNLIKNKQGQTNWADLAAAKAKDSNAVSAEKTTTKADTTANMPAIHVAGLNISDAQISWTDEQANQTLSLSKTNITISELIEDTPFKLKFSTHINSSNPSITGIFTLESTPVISLSKSHFQLDKTSLSFDLTGKTLPGGTNKTSLGGDIIYNGKAQTLDIKNMKLTSYDMTVNGLFHVDKIDTATQYNGQISIETFSPKTLAAALGSALPEMKENTALSSADAKIIFKGDKDKITLSSLEANLDKTSLKGNAVISHFQKPHYGFDLTLNQLNLDYYAVKAEKTSAPAAQTAAKKSTATPKQTSTAASKQSSPVFPIETLRQLNLDGKLTIGQFVAAKAKMTNVVIILKGNKGLVQLAPLKAQLYKGSINLKSTIDARGKTPKLKIINELKNVQIGDLLQDTTGSQEFTGAANISANITTSGNDNDKLIKNSNGTAKLLITDGHINKLDILDTIRKADALFKGRKTPTKTQESNTKFTELKGTLKIKNGIVHNNDLSSQSPVMQLTGKGYADFPKEYLDYTLKIKLLNSIKIDKNTQGNDYKGKEFPYTIKGKFSELSQEANISKVLEQEVKKKAEKEINKQLEKKFGDKFKGLIKF